MAYEWHSVKAASNLKDHGVSFDEAATVFDDPFAEFLPDLRHSTDEDRYICLGTSSAGRLLAVSSPSAEMMFESSPREKWSRKKGEIMKEEIRLLEDDDYDLNDELPAELDIEAIRAEAKRQGREYRGRFAGAGVRVEPEIIEFFKTPEVINDVLRRVMAEQQKAA